MIRDLRTADEITIIEYVYDKYGEFFAHKVLGFIESLDTY